MSNFTDYTNKTEKEKYLFYKQAQNKREKQERLELLTQSSWSTYSALAGEREYKTELDPVRTEFQKDRDKILHSKAFRRLKQKTQVFLSPSGDLYRTRMTHTLEATQVARTIARALGLNEDLTEAIALAHDLGHTPFGHAGEAVLNELYKPGFTHFEQGVRVVQKIENNGAGLNLTPEVIDGIRNHTRGEWAHTPEGKIVRFADQIAYICHDIEDAVRAGVMDEDDLPAEITDVLGQTKSQRLTTMINAVIEESELHKDIVMEPNVHQAFEALKAWMFANVYLNHNSGKEEEKKVKPLITALYNHYINNPDELPVLYSFIADRDGLERAVVDYIAGMTDTFAIEDYCRLFVPKQWDVI